MMLKISDKFSTSSVSRIPGARSIHRFFTRMTDPEGIILISVQGSKMFVNTQDKAIVPYLLTKGIWEEYETQLIHNLIKPGDTVIDIGANIGYYSLIAAKLTGKDGMVYSFEPEPGNYELLVKNVKINNYHNVIPVQKAISNENGELKLYLDKTNLGSHSFIEGDDRRRKAGVVTVKTTTLDDYFGEEDKEIGIDFIKMDAEGAEGLVIQGAKKVIKKYTPKILMEFWPNGLRKLGTDPVQLLDDLQEFGYNIKVLDEENHEMKEMQIEKIMDFCDKKKLEGIHEINLFLEK